MRRTLPLAALAAMVACEPSERPPQSAAPQAPIAAVSAPTPEPTPAPAPPLPSARSLVGQCGHNPSDDALIGRIVRVGPEGRNSLGQREPGSHAVTMRLTPAKAELSGRAEIAVTYPRYLRVRPCP